MLENLSGIDLPPDAVAAERRALIRRLALNSTELAAIDRITVELRSTLRGIRQTSANIRSRGTLSPADVASLAARKSTRDRAITQAATSLSWSQRPPLRITGPVLSWLHAQVRASQRLSRDMVCTAELQHVGESCTNRSTTVAFRMFPV